jgi:hypothetical protein
MGSPIFRLSSPSRCPYRPGRVRASPPSGSIWRSRDLRVASRDASFTSAFARMALILDGGSTFTLPRLVGIGPALRLPLAGETTMPPALAIGLDAWRTGAARRGGDETPPVSPRGDVERPRDQAVGAGGGRRVGAGARDEGAAQLQALGGPSFDAASRHSP